MEILAPAGSPEALAAAIDGGADAVYLGGKQFGARKNSVNFEDSEIEGAIKYAHEKNVKVYVTVNTLIKDSEMNEAVSYIRFLKNINADAVIIQDIGLLNAVKNVSIEKHASTQMGIHSKAGLQWCHENGISRAILARELTLEEMREVIKDSPIDVEIFVQGALCYCVSGGCLFSSLAGGRSGNRGECAQPCRKRYVTKGRKGYLLNTRDLYCVDLLDEFREMGIVSMKIEGRMRAPVHSYLTAKVYSSAMKGEDAEEERKLLETIFNRGYGHGYMDGVQNVVQTVYPDNRGLFLGEAEINNNRLNMKDLRLNIKDGISIYRGEEKVGGFKVGDENATIPFKIPEGTYEIFRTYDPRIDVVKNSFSEVPRFTGKTKRPPVAKLQEPVPRKRTNADISVYVSSVKVLNAVKRHADRIYFEMNDELPEAKEICEGLGKEIVTILPRFYVSDIDTEGPVMVHNIGQMHAYGNERKYGSWHMNMFNSFFPNDAYQMTLSAEMSKHDIQDLLGRYGGRVEQMVFGRTEMMITRDPDMKNGTLTDEKEYQFPVFRDSRGWAHILNSADLMLLDHITDMEKMGIDSLGLDLRRRPAELAKVVADAFKTKNWKLKDKIKEICGSITYGHYTKGLN